MFDPYERRCWDALPESTRAEIQEIGQIFGRDAANECFQEYVSAFVAAHEATLQDARP
jgi:hypothetical protein